MESKVIVTSVPIVSCLPAALSPRARAATEVHEAADCLAWNQIAIYVVRWNRIDVPVIATGAVGRHCVARDLYERCFRCRRLRPVGRPIDPVLITGGVDEV